MSSSPIPEQHPDLSPMALAQQVQQLSQQLNTLAAENVQLHHMIQSRNSNANGPEPKIMLPEKFNGRHSELRNFISAIRNVFDLQPSRYNADRSKTGLIGSLCVGDALSWYRTLQENDSPLLQNFNDFVTEFFAHFGDPYVQDNARRQLLSLSQGRQSASAYAAKFRRIASDTGFDDQSLRYHFERGLNQDVRKAIAVNDQEFEQLTDFIKYSIRVDNRLYESSRLFVQSTPNYRGPTPMEIGRLDANEARKLTSSEKEHRMKNALCLYCGKPNHIARSCPNKRSVIVATINAEDSKNE